MFVSALIGRTLSCAMQRLLPKTFLNAPSSAVAQAANRLISYRAQCANAKGGSKKKEEKKEKKDKKKKSMWLNPECCLDPCPDIQPRFDDLYYKPSDKLKRIYTQTWIECPKVRLKRKKICCPQNVIPPPFKRRKPKSKRARGEEECKPRPTDLMPCRPPSNLRSKCPKLLLPGCSPVRDPPKCRRERVRVKCSKICTPYPSFSECMKKKPRPLRPIECRCLDIPSLCEVWEEMRRRESIKKVQKQ